ncbi:hypothetical protein FOA52_006320 [Chlamydomonas sp. UWO 241]|nr:hypothetical protein FOA52_006320 [Chlamydomonas sp. UWO 241]
MTSLFKLNVTAQPYVPVSRARDECELDPVGGTGLLDLPREVLSVVLASLGGAPAVVACMACKGLMKELAFAPLSVSVGSHMADMPAAEASQHVEAVAASLAKYTPGLASLDVSGAPVDASDVASLLCRLTSLRALSLAGCRRITGAVVDKCLCMEVAAPSTAPAALAEHPDPHPGSSTPHPAAPLPPTRSAPPSLLLLPPATLHPARHLTTLNLQRCFQLNGAALAQLLGSCHADGALPSLRCLAMSHLALAGIDAQLAGALLARVQRPAGDSEGQGQGHGTLAAGNHCDGSGQSPGTGGDDASGDSGSRGSGSNVATEAAPAPECAVGPSTMRMQRATTIGLTLLALHNCTGLGAAALRALADACPRLEVLLLGGCAIGDSPPRSSAGGAGAFNAAAAAVAPAAGAADIAALLDGDCDDDGLPSLAAVCAAVHVCPSLAPVTAGAGVGACTGAGVHLPMMGGGGPGSAALPPIARARAASAAAALVYGVLRLGRLTALELTFAGGAVECGVRAALDALLPSGDATATTAAAAAAQGGAHAHAGGRAMPQLWDFTSERGLSDARAALADHVRAHPGSGGAQASAAELLPAALRAAVNCSSSSRQTPLHMAAFARGACGGGGAAEGSGGGECGGSGSVSVVAWLLGLGAGVDARDAGGCTPLFLASEAGREGAVRDLLAAGADPGCGNAAGESPLYIAALKGHLCVVRSLVDSLVACGIDWPSCTFPDGWTPLMAAVVAGHTHVVRWLLASATQQAGGRGAACLLAASNRYGQSALHIAARKGSPQLLRLLLFAGGHDALGAADALGLTPMDVAVKHSHQHAASLFAEFRRCTVTA